MYEAMKIWAVFILWFCLIGFTLRAVFHEPDLGLIIEEEFEAQGMVIQPPPKADPCEGHWLDPFNHRGWMVCA